MAFYCGCSTKYNPSIIKCANCFFLYARHYIGAKTEAHDHFFQKSGSSGQVVLHRIMMKIEKNGVLLWLFNQKQFQFHKLC